MRITLNYVQGLIQLDWLEPQVTRPQPTVVVRYTDSDELTWELQEGSRRETDLSSLHRNSIRARLRRFQ